MKRKFNSIFRAFTHLARTAYTHTHKHISIESASLPQMFFATTIYTIMTIIVSRRAISRHSRTNSRNCRISRKTIHEYIQIYGRVYECGQPNVNMWMSKSEHELTIPQSYNTRHFPQNFLYFLSFILYVRIHNIGAQNNITSTRIYVYIFTLYFCKQQQWQQKQQ